MGKYVLAEARWRFAQRHCWTSRQWRPAHRSAAERRQGERKADRRTYLGSNKTPLPPISRPFAPMCLASFRPVVQRG